MNSYTAVPQLLLDLPNWVVWKLQTRDGRPTKVPYDANSNGHHRGANCNDSSTWSTFDRALEVASDIGGYFNGVGFEFSNCPVAGVEFDHIIRDGNPEPFALEILKLLNNPYTEISPSGEGLHAYVRASLPGEIKGRKFSANGYGAEIYFEGRFFTVTGNHYSGEGVPEIADISLVHFLVSQFKNEKFKKLWLGDISEYDNDQSRADLALADMLALHLNKDAQKVEQYFSASRLGRRDKWRTREDYRRMTVDKACETNALPTSTARVIPLTKELEFHLLTVQTGNHRDYVLAPLPGQYDGWFPLGNVSLIGGPSGSNKTTFILQLLLSQHIKAPFFGHETCGHSFLMLGADRGEDAHKRTMERMHLNPAVVPFQPLPLAWNLDAAQAIVNQIEATNPPPEIVFIEGVDMLVTEVNSIRVVSDFMHQLQKIARHYHIAIIGSLGSPKSRQGHGYAATRENFLGSAGWGRTAETMALLQFPQNDDTSGKRKLTVVLRNAQAEKFTLGFRDGQLEVTPDEPEGESSDLAAAEEIEWFQAQAKLAKSNPEKKWWTILDMERAFHLKHATADRHVKDAYAKKYLVQKPGSKNGRGLAKEFRWNESKTNLLWVDQQKQEAGEQVEAF